MEVYTSTINYKGLDRLDITVKSATTGKFLAPTWEMVMEYKQNVISEDEYKRLYIALMRQSYRKFHAKWYALTSQERVTLVCYCKAGDFCHRLLLAEILVKLGAEYKGEIQV